VLSLTESILLFSLTFAASFIAAITGGAGMFTIPLMMVLGIPPQIAISTNKVGGLGMMSGGLLRFSKEKSMDWSLSLKLALLAGVSGYFGAHLLGHFETDDLRRIAGVLVLILLVLSRWFRSLGIESVETSKRKVIAAYPLLSFIFFFGGFFGAGMGVFSAFTLIYFQGKTIIDARGNLFLAHLSLSAVSLFVLHKQGFVNWNLGLLLAVAMILGSYSGMSFGIKKGPAWVKKIFDFIIALMAIVLLIL